MNRALTLSLLLLCAPVAMAQDASPADRTTELLAGMTQIDESLLGTTWYGLHMGNASMGTCKVVVEKAPADSGAVYKVSVTLHIAMAQRTMEETALFNADLSIVSTNETRKEGGKPPVTVTMNKEGESWVHVTKTPASEAQEAQEVRQTAPVSGPDHWNLASNILLAPRMADKGGKFVLKGVHWKEGQSECAAAEMAVETHAAEAYEFRGEQLQARRVVVDRIKDKTTFHVDAKGRVLAFAPDNAPIKLLRADSEEQAKAALPEKNAGGEVAAGGAATPLDAVKVYFHVLAKAKPVDALDGVMDWKAIRDEMFKDDPDNAGLDPDTVASLLKGQFKAAKAPITKEMADMVAGMMTINENAEAGTATAEMPGRDGGFRLRKEGDSWLITHFPH